MIVGLDLEGPFQPEQFIALCDIQEEEEKRFFVLKQKIRKYFEEELSEMKVKALHL